MLAGGKNDRNLKARIRLIHHAGSMEISPSQPHVQLLLQNVARFTGVKRKVMGVPYWTDASILLNRARIPSCIFGAGDIKFAHSKNENVKEDDVLMAARIYAATAQEYCNIR
jgi:acetylornithine deacetylase/succinyl-diaminopimelate desuccinylase-like protein